MGFINFRLSPTLLNKGKYLSSVVFIATLLVSLGILGMLFESHALAFSSGRSLRSTRGGVSTPTLRSRAVNRHSAFSAHRRTPPAIFPKTHHKSTIHRGGFHHHFDNFQHHNSPLAPHFPHHRHFAPRFPHHTRHFISPFFFFSPNIVFLHFHPGFIHLHHGFHFHPGFIHPHHGFVLFPTNFFHINPVFNSGFFFFGFSN